MGANNSARVAQCTKSDCRALGLGGRHGGPSVLPWSRKSYKEVIEPPVRLFVDIDRGIGENILKLLSFSLHLFSLKKSNFFEVLFLMSHFNHSLLHLK